MTSDDYGVFERALLAFSILLFGAMVAAFTLQNCHQRDVDQTHIEGEVYIEIEAVTIEDHRVPMVERDYSAAIVGGITRIERESLRREIGEALSALAVLDHALRIEGEQEAADLRGARGIS